VFFIALIALARPAWSSDATSKTKPATRATKAVATPSKTASSTCTLDAIRIEGEIDVPQVLFITARDYRRFRDGTPAKYQTTSAAIAKSVPLPNRVRIVAPVE
jgi:hypothetical protein